MNYKEIKERQEAELEFVKAVYTSDEAWITTTSTDKKDTQYSIHRLLRLPTLLTSLDATTPSTDSIQHENSIPIELIITMPPTYPIDPKSILNIQIKIKEEESKCNNSSPIRKIVFNSLPKLLKLCFDVASDEYIEEAIFEVFNKVEDWIQNEWKDILSQVNEKNDNDSHDHHDDESDYTNNNINKQQVDIILSRKLIFSHHIIAKSKRKALKELSSEYQLSGFVKIGWPGIIIIEGEEQNCNHFIHNIRQMRWQYLVVRGEEKIKVQKQEIEIFDSLRKFPFPLKELDDNQMSYLGQFCRDVGLENLFMTSMNIYKENDNYNDNTLSSEKVDDIDNTSNNIDDNERDKIYGVLIHVDHMNDEKGYRKWIQKACKSSGCSFFIKQCNYNDHNNKIKTINTTTTNKVQQLIILVSLWGDINAVKQVLKRWRTSRVDVDSRGNPCLERMMTILQEGYVECTACSYNDNVNDVCDSQSSECSIDELRRAVKVIGAEVWENSFLSIVDKK